ncbi:MAG: HypC/HybG/HupF family hydrogenase formation chaperone [Phycisphaerales bacterium]
MCLALPARIVERDGILAWVTVGETRMRVSLIMTPEAESGDWVLVHAGFAIRQVEERDALETWELIQSVAGASTEASP